MPETEWNRTTAPQEGAIVHVLAMDKRGQYLIPFPVVFRDDSWWNARTGEELDTFIVGWRPAAMNSTSASKKPGAKPG
jgi:hypothetical protein